MTIRQLHRFIGSIFAAFFAFSAIIAIPLFWRKEGLYSDSTKEFLVSLHTWEIGAKYSGIILAMALIFMSCTGLLMIYGTRGKPSSCGKSNTKDTAIQ